MGMAEEHGELYELFLLQVRDAAEEISLLPNVAIVESLAAYIASPEYHKNDYTPMVESIVKHWQKHEYWSDKQRNACIQHLAHLTAMERV